MSNWGKFYNEEYQLDYYYNSVTGQSQWEPPEGFLESASSGGKPHESNGTEASQPSVEPTCLGDEEYYLFNPELAFLDEMSRMGFMSVPPDEEVHYILSGGINSSIKKKIEALDLALQTTGSDEEWALVIHAEGMALLRYLICFLPPSVHIELAEVGARCLVYIGNICPTVWMEYCAGDVGSAGVLVSVVKNAAARLYQIVAASGAPIAHSAHGTYSGFDERDVKEFGLSGMQEIVEAYHRSKGLASLSAEQTQTSMLILLMIIEKSLEHKNKGIAWAVEFYREVQTAAKAKSDQTADEAAAVDIVESLLSTARLLYNLLRTVKEEVYLNCIKAIAFINFQFPGRGGDVCSFSTEISELCCKMKFEEPAHDSGSANLAEGLLHTVNDIGYPAYDVPEALPILVLCSSLVCSPGYDGYFYTNDVKVLVEVIIRELVNLPVIDGRVQTVFTFEGGAADNAAPLREMYIRFSGALVDNTAWSTTGEKHKFEEVRAAIEGVLEYNSQLSEELRGEFGIISSKFY